MVVDCVEVVEATDPVVDSVEVVVPEVLVVPQAVKRLRITSIITRVQVTSFLSNVNSPQ